jgi:galacturonosyltransferase
VNHEIVIYNFRKELVEALIINGYNVILSCPYGKNIDKLTKLGVIHVDSKIDRRGTTPFKDLRLLYFYKKLIKIYKPNIVLTYTIKPNVFGGMAAMFTKTPYISTITGLGSAIENKGLLNYVATKLYKFSLKKADFIFFQNKENMNFMLRKGITGKQHKLIPGSGVNVNYYEYNEYPQDSTINFIFVGRVMKDKGIDYFLETATTIKKKYPNTIFHIIGDYEEDYNNILNEYQSKGYVKYHGKVDDLREYYKMAHAIIHPSLHEGMSNVLLEAASSGRPVLASNIPGCIETFDNERSGISFRVKNQESLNQTVEKFISLPFDQKRQMGIEGRTKVVKMFNRDEIVKIYLNKISNIMENN